MMHDETEIDEAAAPDPRRSGSWLQKFGNAFRGIKVAVRAEVSFFVHLFVTAIVLMTGLQLGISRLEWCLLVLSIAGVITAELCNTAIERLARAITQAEHQEIRDALDIASGAVLAASLSAAVVGVIVLGRPLLAMMS
ncbi:diacylglycerol kinase family protein [Bythopirellula polymerisocia]|uniref:Undecaprenol kinase n=1 Tax=Bythopirellula polymerisocia TaxID=2528003 RepID=A0A5C6CZM7_9BACT|nr:diacylglycerol kinase family protein [Bythopirellula polymerisocia]TWU28119.1 Undecaprenol kinase [Bythopirellula polymerisocia]